LRPPPLFRREAGIWVPPQPGFREDLYRAREIRGDISFGEQILDVADDSSNDWGKAENAEGHVRSGVGKAMDAVREIVNKE
jgi:uncharacterized protein YjbJ (UPF0337 family)